MLLEVAHVLTRQEILTGEVRMPLADGKRDRRRALMREQPATGTCPTRP